MPFGGGRTSSAGDPLGGRSEPSIPHGPGGPAEDRPSRAPLRAVAFVLIAILVAAALVVAASFLYRLAADALEEGHDAPDGTQIEVDQVR